MSLLRFLLSYFFYTLILALLVYAIQIFAKSDILVPKIWTIFIFLALITLIAYLISLAGSRIKGEGSVWVMMGPMIMKLLVSLIFVVIYLQKFKVSAIPFALEFFSLYFLFSTFEVYSLLCNLRHQNKKLKSPNR